MGIECLVSIAVIGAFAIGEFSEVAVVTFLFQFGSWLEQKTMKKTRSSIKALTKLAPTVAWRIDGDSWEMIDADEVEAGDLLLVKTGGQIPADGIVAGGEGYVNEASITGESLPRHKEPGDLLYAGTTLESVHTFVGDGINDTPSITAADTGIAMGSGTDAAIDCSDVVLIKSDLGSVALALRLAKKITAVMYENIAIAIVTVLLLLAGLFAGYIHMSVGMLVHEASILIVILNAMRILL